MPSFLSCARIKLGLVRPDEYNDLILSVASLGRPSLVNEKNFFLLFYRWGKIEISGDFLVLFRGFFVGV